MRQFTNEEAWRIIEAIASLPDDMTDEEIAESYREAGEHPARVAADTRALMLRTVDEWERARVSSMPNPTEIDRRFTPARVEGMDMDRFAQLNDAYRKFAHMLDEMLPEGREKACALTDLQSSKFWANESNAKR